MRNVLGVIVGLIVGMILNMALVLLNVMLFPMPEGMDMNDPEQFNAYLAPLPDHAFLLPVAAHLGMAFAGGWVAARIGSSRPVLLAMIIGVLSLAGGVVNLMTLTEAPTWMWLEVPLYLVVAWCAGKRVARSREGQAAA